MRHCYQCTNEIPLERRSNVFCSLRCERLNQELTRRSPPMDGSEEPEDSPADRLSQRYSEFDSSSRSHR